jgi:hypothetical protein
MREGVTGARLPPQTGVQVYERGGFGGGSTRCLSHPRAHAKQVLQHVETTTKLREDRED